MRLLSRPTRTTLAGRPRSRTWRWLALAAVPAAVLVVSLHAAAPLPPQAEAALASITASSMAAHIRFLTSPLLEGRVVGHRGNEIAEQYVAAAMEQGALDGINDRPETRYFQPFEMIGAVRGPGNQLTIRDESTQSGERVEIGLDFSPINISAATQAAGPLVFAGYGITAPEAAYDDYAGIDARGKIVIVLDGSGRFAAGLGTPTAKVLTAQAHGAAGLLIAGVTDGNRTWPAQVSPKVNRFILPARADNVALPVATVSVAFADRLLASSTGAPASGAAPAARSVAALKQALAAGRTPVSFDLAGRRATLAIDLVRRRVTVRNVVARVEGGDPALRQELVVIGAHFDANGIDADGKIYAGADDDASGTAAVMAVAQAFAQAARNGARPRRTVVFALWNAEEKGRGGSTYYAGHPVPEGRRVIFNLNLDHAGRNEEVPVGTTDPRFNGFPAMAPAQNDNVVHLLGYTYVPDAARVVMEENQAIGLTVKQDYDTHVSNLVQRSDHWSFISIGIPAIFLCTGLHPDYHMPTDTIEKINFPKLEKIARLAYRTAWRLADQDARPALVGRSPGKDR